MILKKTRSGRCEATPTLFRPFSPMNSGFGNRHRLRRCEWFFRKGGGSESEAILTKFKKNFCSQIFFVILEMLNPLLVSWQKWLF